MKKKAALFFSMIFAAVCLGGCGNEYTTLAEMNTNRYVELGQYKGLEISVPVMEVTQDYVDNYIGVVLSNHVTWEKAGEDYPAQMGDTVTIDYVGKIDGEPFERGADQNYDLMLGSGDFIPGFESGLVGVRAGETRDVPVTFPDPYLNNPDMSGVDTVFTVTVHSVSARHLPELTDDFVKSLDVGCSTVEEYRAYVFDLGQKEAQETYDRNVEDALVSKVMAGCTFREPPKAMVDEYYDRVVRNMTKIAGMSNMSFETFITGYYGITMEEFEEEARAGARASCQESIMLQAIANEENIAVSQEEIDAAIAEGVEKGGYADADELIADRGEDNFEDYVMCDKVLTLLKENAVITNYE